MAEINIGSGPSYTIPLDSLDLAYLGKYVRTPRAEKMPLWTKERLDGESEYCQVQIVTRDNNNEDCYSEPSDTYQCHICNINVPKICYQKHNESYQHETVKKIHQKVLERVSKQMDVNSMNSDGDIGTDLYYCGPCSKIIKIENKNHHEATEYHTKSVKKIFITDEFYKILNEDIGLRSDVNEEILGEGSDPFILNNNYGIYQNSMGDSSNIDSDNIDYELFDPNSILAPAPGPSTSETNNQSPAEERKHSFEKYLREMIIRYNLNVTVPVVDGKFITIVAPNGDKAKVSHEHFQGYRELTNNNMYCQLCNMWLSEDTRAHDVSEQHVRNIFTPINEKFARSVDTAWSHCIPCNELVQMDSDLHTLNEVHKKNIKDARTPKIDKTLCEVCNLRIDTHNFTIHINSKKHLKVLMKQHSIQDTGSNNIFCRICNLNIPRCALKSHIDTELHLENKTNNSTEINNENNTSIESLATGVIDTDAGYCELCNVSVPGGGMKIHTNGKSHQNKLVQLSSASQPDVEPNENEVEINPIIDARPSTSANTGSSVYTNRIHESVASISTMSSLSNYGNESDHEGDKMDAYYNMTEFIDETRTKVRCKICSVTINFLERNIIEHMEGRNHIEKVNKQKLEGYSKLLFYTDTEKTKLKCQICDVTIPNCNRNVIEHMEGRNHEIAEDELLKFHLITRESSEYICECCEIRTTDYIEHMNSRSHTLEFSEKYEIDRNEIRKYVYDDAVHNSVARRHRVRYRNLLKHNGILRIDNANHFCGVCQIKLGRKSEIDHVFGERHRSKVEKVNNLSSLLQRLELADVII